MWCLYVLTHLTTHTYCTIYSAHTCCTIQWGPLWGHHIELPWLNLHTVWPACTHTCTRTHTYTHTCTHTHTHIHTHVHTHTHVCIWVSSLLYVCIFCDKDPEASSRSTTDSTSTPTVHLEYNTGHIDLQWLTQHRSTCMDTHYTHRNVHFFFFFY